MATVNELLLIDLGKLLHFRYTTCRQSNKIMCCKVYSSLKDILEGMKAETAKLA